MKLVPGLSPLPRPFILVHSKNLLMYLVSFRCGLFDNVLDILVGRAPEQ